jgi:N utilization substance protein B
VTAPADARASERDGRRLALGALFEADFGLRTPQRVLERRLEEEGADPVTAAHARTLVDAVTRHRDSIDAEIERRAPAYPVVQLARIDRALLRSAMGELLHCPATPTRVAIAEWVEMARTYSGEPTRRLVNGVLGQVAQASTRKGPERGGHAGPDSEPTDVTKGHEEGSTQ